MCGLFYFGLVFIDTLCLYTFVDYDHRTKRKGSGNGDKIRTVYVRLWILVENLLGNHLNGDGEFSEEGGVR